LFNSKSVALIKIHNLFYFKIFFLGNKSSSNKSKLGEMMFFVLFMNYLHILQKIVLFLSLYCIYTNLEVQKVSKHLPNP